MTTLFILIALAMFITVTLLAGRHQQKVGVRVQTWDEYAHSKHLDRDDFLQ